MQGHSNRRRIALLGVGFSAIAPGLVLAARPQLTLATGALPPLTAAPGHVGFLDALAREVFGRVGFDATVVRLPVERALINANAGIEDGDMFRASGFEKDYPNLLPIPEKVLDFDFVAYATRAEVEVRDWSDLARYGVGYVVGYKIFERNVKAARDITTVRGLDQLFALLVGGRVDVVLLDRWQGLWLAREAGLAVRALDPPLARVPMFAYLHRRHEALVAPAAAALAEVKRDGTWQRLYDQTLKPLEPAR
jgi:polar amino acid transport system substrate-binding protein